MQARVQEHGWFKMDLLDLAIAQVQFLNLILGFQNCSDNLTCLKSLLILWSS